MFQTLTAGPIDPADRRANEDGVIHYQLIGKITKSEGEQQDREHACSRKLSNWVILAVLDGKRGHDGT